MGYCTRGICGFWSSLHRLHSLFESKVWALDILVGTMRILRSALIFVLATGFATAQQHPRDGQIHDADTLAWWHTTEALSNDSMEGRDTGSAAYQRAAEYVAARFKAAGLKPAGENDSYLQTVPMHEVAVEPAGTSFVVERPGGELKLGFLQEITVGASEQALRGVPGVDVVSGRPRRRGRSVRHADRPHGDRADREQGDRPEVE